MTGINIVKVASTSNCISGMIISTVGGAGDHFRASITKVHYLTGEIESIVVSFHGSGYSSDPQFVISSANCRCNGLSGSVAGNFDACLTARRAHGASVGGIVALDAVVEGSLPRFYLSGLKGVQNSDSLHIPLQRHGFHYKNGQKLFGQYGQWIKASHTLVLRLTGLTMLARQNYSVEFYLQNPVELQHGPAISIRTSGITSRLAPLETAPQGSILQALSIAGFNRHSVMTQANPAQNGTNKISVALIPQLTHPLASRVQLLDGGEHYIPVSGHERTTERETQRERG